jgi:hypothetical protein
MCSGRPNAELSRSDITDPSADRANGKVAFTVRLKARRRWLWQQNCCLREATATRNGRSQKKRDRTRSGSRCKSMSVRKSMVLNSRSMAGGPHKRAEISR